jgi:hypothetical protein
VLKDYASTDTVFIDPAEALVEKLGELLPTGDQNGVFFTTGDAGQMKRSAKLAFGVEIQTVRKIEV